jgi:hypothetical protein
MPDSCCWGAPGRAMQGRRAQPLVAPKASPRTPQRAAPAASSGAERALGRPQTHTANLANDAALGFEFQYCRFEPSRFT